MGFHWEERQNYRIQNTHNFNLDCFGKRIFKKQIQISEELKLTLNTLGIFAPQLSNYI
jgi:hypothetical protein